jgi:hypothetical protein
MEDLQERIEQLQGQSFSSGEPEPSPDENQPPSPEKKKG